MIALYWLLIAVMGVGIIGSAVPGLPGISLVLVAIIVWGVAHGFAGLALPLTVAIVVLLFSIGIEFLATYWGAKAAGASRWGQIGAIIGFVVGILGLLPALPVGGPLLGMLLGPIVGAIVGEFLYQKDIKRAVKAGLGIVVGSLVGNLLELALAIVTVGIFIVVTWPQVYGT